MSQKITRSKLWQQGRCVSQSLTAVFCTDAEVHCLTAVIAQALRISRLVSTAQNCHRPDCVS